MAETTFLPDPKWSEAAAICPGCGYSLAGIAPPTPCPECGLLYEGHQFVVHGVPTARSVMSPWRVALIVVFAVFAWLGPQALIMIGTAISWWISLTGLIAGLVAIVVVVKTAPKSHGGGSAQLLFVNGGVHVVPLKIEGTEARIGSFIRFTGTERVTFKPAGPFWGRLIVTAREGARLLDAGIRCPQEMREGVVQTIEVLIRSGCPAPRFGASPPTRPVPPPPPSGESRSS